MTSAPPPERSPERPNDRSTRQTIVQLLSNMSDGKEIRTYLQRFAEVDRERFAVIKIGGAVLRDTLEETANALAFLHTVGLTPIVLHGGGPQLDAALAAAGVETPKHDGLRATSAEALDVARGVFVTENVRLAEAVRAQGVGAHSLTVGAIEADFLDREKLGFVGEPTNVRLEIVSSIVRAGAVPILTCLGLAPGGQLLNVNGDSATRALVAALKPMKIVFLSSVGGLLNAKGETISAINLATDYDKLMAADWVEGGMRLKLTEIKRLLDAAPAASVSITTPTARARELFTHSGAGTLVRRGERIARYTHKAEIDRNAVERLVEAAFEARLAPGWWDGLDLLAAHVSENARAGAILTRLDVGPQTVAYLDKFAVLENARGEGLARTVWRRFVKRQPAFFWRSRAANGFNAFYHDVADGAVSRGGWKVFWIGEADFARIGPAVERIAALPASFVADDAK
ncbi:MAG: acetylglutamate kinase [Parvularculaceae bacterium]